MAGKTEWEDICGQADMCALSGAAAFFAGIPQAAVVLNGPLWCYFYAKRYLEKANPSLNVGGRFICTQADANSVVYGTEEYLLETLNSLKEECPSQVFIINSCAIGLIGDDIDGIASEAKLGCPVIYLNGGGLQGGFSSGYKKAAKTYFSAGILNEPISPILPDTVNLLGTTFGYYNEENDVLELKRLLALAGYKVLACPGLGSSLEEIAAMTQAELNIVVHEELGLELAQYLKANYNMPYFSQLPPYGFEGTLLWLEKIVAQTTGNSLRFQKAWLESAAREEELKLAVREVRQLWEEIEFGKAVIAAPPSVAFGMAAALEYDWPECGRIEVTCQNSFLENPDFVSGKVIVLEGNSALEQSLKEMRSGDLLLGSCQEKKKLRQWDKTKIIWQNVALPVYDEIILTGRPFMGLRGSSYMIEKLWNQFMDIRFR